MGDRKQKRAVALKESKKNIAFAKLNNCPTSPRKMRLVADQVRGKQVELALNLLRYSPKEASRKLEKSYIGIVGRGIEPIVQPLGYDWKIGIAIVSSFAARAFAASELVLVQHRDLWRQCLIPLSFPRRREPIV